MRKCRSAAVLVSFLVLGAGAVFGAGCGGDDESTASSARESTDGSASSRSNGELFIGDPSPELCAGNRYRFGYDAFTDAEETVATIKRGLEELASELGCVEVVATVNNADPTTAVDNARTFVQQRLDGTVLFNLTPAAASGQIRVLDREDIPSVLIGARAPGAPFVTVDEDEAGRIAGSELAKAFKAEHPNATPYVLAGRADEAGAVYVSYIDSFVEGIQEEIPDLLDKNVIPLATKADPAAAQSAARDALNRVPGEAPVLAMGINSATTFAILQAVKQARRSGPVMVVDGRGGAYVAPQLCKNPAYVGVVDYHFEDWAKYFLPAVIDRVQGKDVPEEIVMPLDYISAQDLCREQAPE